MTTRHADRFGLKGPGPWILAAVVSLGAVRSAAAEDAAKAEAQRLAAELNKAKAQVAVLETENKKLRDELKEARNFYEEIRQATRAENADVIANLEKEKTRIVESADAAARKAQSEIDRLSGDLLKKTAESRTHEERLSKLIEQVAAVQQELAALQPKKPDEPKPAPKVEPKPGDDGPSADQLKRLTERLLKQEEEARSQAEQALRAAEMVRLEALQARQAAEAREKAARAVGAGPNPDPARLEAEVRAARFEAQLNVMQMAYQDLRQDASRLRAELDAERKARLEQAARGGAADPNTQQRLANLEAVVTKLALAIEVLMKKNEATRPEK